MLPKKLSFMIDKQLVIYCLVGGGNTLVTLIAIFILTWCGVSLYQANIIGYMFGILTSYLLNSKYTFSKRLSYQRMFNFLIVVIVSYLFNLLTIYSFRLISSQSLYLSQFLGILVYTLISFFLNKYWALK